MRLRRLLMAVPLFALLAGSALPGDDAYTPTAENLKARAWFQDAKFGLFIHWGVYSTLGDGEWVMNNRKIKVAEYEKLPAFFDPQAYDPAEWVAMAKRAGMRYITITSKHHDGFAMWDSKVSDYNVVARTPYKKDVLKRLADECHKQGVTLFFYHSHLDWHHPDYFPRGRVGLDTGRPEAGEWSRYLDYLDAQLKELLTGYGAIGGIWFDGWWDKPQADWRLARTYRLIHELQPAALVGNNHHVKPFPGEDFQMFEKDLPGHNTAGFNEKAEIGELPREMCETMNNSWGFNLLDTKYKSTKDLVRLLVKAAGYDANLLLNVGPMPNGKIQPEFQERLDEVGGWLAKNGDSIYETRGGPIGPRDWGVTTRKGTKVFVHVLEWSDPVLALPRLPAAVKRAYTLRDGAPVAVSSLPDAVTLRLRPDRDPIDTVIVLELTGPSDPRERNR
jgi:alpha-L-fucosidase